MTIFNNKKIKAIIIVFVTLVTLVEVYFAYKITQDCKGIYQVQIFVPLVLQPLYVSRLLKKERAYFKLRILALLLCSVLLPLVIYSTLPNYTYIEGKEIIHKFIGQDNSHNFTEVSFAKSTVPVIDNTKQVFVSDREYYYEVTSKEGSIYFMVNPVTGKVMKLEKSYW
jgi:hypothetical protein